MALKKCPNCQNSINDTEPICPYCGNVTGFKDSLNTKVICPKCNSLNNANLSNCIYCGQELHKLIKDKNKSNKPIKIIIGIVIFYIFIFGVIQYTIYNKNVIRPEDSNYGDDHEYNDNSNYDDHNYKDDYDYNDDYNYEDDYDYEDEEDEILETPEVYDKTITIKEYNDLLNSDEDVMVVFGSNYCVHCLQYKNTIKELQAKHDVDIYFVDCYNLTDQELEAYNIKGTPTTKFIQNGQVVEEVLGYREYSDIINIISSINDFDY